jgi:hypothetical protein
MPFYNKRIAAFQADPRDHNPRVINTRTFRWPNQSQPSNKAPSAFRPPSGAHRLTSITTARHTASNLHTVPQAVCLHTPASRVRPACAPGHCPTPPRGAAPLPTPQSPPGAASRSGPPNFLRGTEVVCSRSAGAANWAFGRKENVADLQGIPFTFPFAQILFCSFCPWGGSFAPLWLTLIEGFSHFADGDSGLAWADWDLRLQQVGGR